MILGKTIRLADGETAKVTSNWAAETEKRGTTVSSSVWETTAGTLSSAALSTPVATVFLAENGDATLTNTATLANGEVLIKQWRVTVK